MTSQCSYCFIKPLDDYIFISKFYYTKCTHLQDKVHLEYSFSLKFTLVQIIYYLILLITTTQSITELKKNPNMEPSKYWSEFAFAALPLFAIIACTSMLITNKDRFDFHYLFTDLLTFARQTKMRLIKRSDLKQLDKNIKLMRILLFLNPVSASCLYYVCNIRDNILLEVNLILITYMIFSFCFYSIIHSLMHSMMYYNLKNNLNKVFSRIKNTNYVNCEFKIKIKIIQGMLKKFHFIDKKAELIVRPLATATAILIPISIEIILLTIQAKIFTKNRKIIPKYYSRELNLLIVACLSFLVVCIVLIRIELMQRPVSCNQLIFVFFFL